MSDTANLVGTVNGAAASLTVNTAGVDPVTIDIFDDGSPTTIDVDTDGLGYGDVSSRVAYIGGTTAGRDHFPFAAANSGDGGAVAGEGVYPAPYSFDDAMEIAWLVSTWSLTGTFAWSGFTATFIDGDNLTTSYYAGSTGIIEVDVEGDLIALANVGLNEAYMLDVDTPEDGEWEVEGGGCGLFGYDVQIILDSDQFYPAFRFDLYMSASVPDEIDPEVMDSRSFHASTDPSDIEEEPILGGYITVLGYDIPIYYGTSDDDVAPTFDLTFAPKDYWAYETSTGDPVYDTDTGDELTDPLS